MTINEASISFFSPDPVSRGFYAPAAQARYQRLSAFLGHVNKPGEAWTPQCAKCGERVYIISIRVGKRTIIPQATIDYFGIESLLDERPP